ncbi:ABC transporter permease [Fonticella tunisiensis]|uniref:Transport permease protein n=1 Tax=Fonticella tunisiensis TaxID=1096341 RepID=A0A4R7KSK5_9CLOT|nr:ABC transporter permease [Fonticella tunisiensis]TDT62787.1 ABC-2 type transport system permease protein [Fonticella tunisiensis]
MRRIRTIAAVARKEFIKMVRYPTWVIQMLIWPLIFPLLYILSAHGFAGPDKSGLELFKAATGTENYAGFIVVGIMAWMWVNITMWSFGSYLREEQMLGTLESNWLCPINRFDFLIGASLVSALQGLFIAVVSMLEYRFIYGIHFDGNVFLWLLMFLVTVPAVYGMGMLFSGVVLWLKEINAVVNLVRGTMMVLCGITFPTAIMPGWMQILSKALPFTFGLQAARTVMVKGGTLKNASGDIFMCLAEGILLLFLGRIVFDRIEKKVKISGSLERF